ncbi:HTR-like protein [Haloferax volcanii JCM 10717]|uniref:histidine kinase n=1 Tax=Haloferax volcanii JCM 10717 TaxID=1227458 RepID=M0IE87_HALVO|nr:HTR-like protein [Haloferax alexandrinus JCM 10717]
MLVVEDGLGTTQADQGRFQQAFENLFRNAVEHGGSCCGSGDDAAADDAPADETASAESPPTDATDELTVRVGPTETGFYVADNGPGIPADERDTVFEHGHTTSDSGTGFGLSIVESIIEAHGWDIEATAPEADLGGARFEFDIGGVRSEVEPRFSLSDD